MALVAATAAPGRSIGERLAAQMHGLAAWRAASGFGWVEGAVLALYASIAAMTLHYHEAWDDEAQAWLIARDNSVWQMLRYRLHYEGAPPAWHLLLHLFHLLGGTYASIGWLGLAIATTGIYVWLRWSPFPKAVRWLLPFTFFFQYQYAVIARSYVLFPLLTFTLCVLFRRRRADVWFALVAGLLANVSLQGFAAAAALTGLYALDRFGSRTRSEPPVRSRVSYRAAALFAAMACIAVYSAIPAPDLDFAIGDQVSTGTVHRLLVRLIGETPRNAAKGPAEEPFPPPLPETPPRWNTHPRAWLAALVYPRTAPENHYVLRWAFRTIGPPLVEILDQSMWPIASWNVLAAAFLVTVVLWLHSMRRLRMLLPWAVLLGVGLVLWTAEHHAGMFLIALIAGLWLAKETANGLRPSPRLDGVFLVLFLAVLVGQIAWSVYCIRADVRGSYDPGPETAIWMKQHPQPRVAAFGFATVSIQPWFPRSAFFDVPTSWWQWSSNVEVDGIHRSVVATHPDEVVYGLEFPGSDPMRNQWLPFSRVSEDDERTLPRDPIVRDLHGHGYVETHRFCGTRFARFGSAYRVCDMVFEPASR